MRSAGTANTALAPRACATMAMATASMLAPASASVLFDTGRLHSELQKLHAQLDAYNVSASASIANIGTSARLRQRLRWRCRTGGDGLRIDAVGGSMTAGRMNCLNSPPRRCVTRKGEAALRWVHVLQDLLRAALPECNVAVHVGVNDTARETIYGMRITTAAQPRVVPWLVNSRDDLVIEDFSINDVRGWQPSEHKSIAAGMETFTRHVVTRQPPDDDGSRHGPQMVHMESFAVFDPPTEKCEYSKLARKCNPPPRCQNASEPVHLAVARHYAVPVVSFMLGACARDAVDSREPARRLWRASCLDIDRPGNDCEMHPGPTTHRVYALLLAHYVVSQAIAAAHDHAHLRASEEEVMAAGTRQITFPPPGDAGPSLMPAAELASFVGCSHPFTAMDVSASCDPNQPSPVYHIQYVRAPVQNAGWRCFEDVPSKPGWIASGEDNNAAASEIEFRMLLSQKGYVVISYLRSYVGMGRASVYLKGFNREVVVDGTWQSHTSQTDITAIANSRLLPYNYSMSTTGGETTMIKKGGSKKVAKWFTVVVRKSGSTGGGGKFKVTSIATC